MSHYRASKSVAMSTKRPEFISLPVPVLIFFIDTHGNNNPFTFSVRNLYIVFMANT